MATTVTAARGQWVEEGGGETAAQRCLDFLKRLGIETGWLKHGDEQLLTGLAIMEGRLLIDPQSAVWPGDLLHEAGHIALAAPEDRATLGPIKADAADEMATIAWSYAASLECGIGLEELFHNGGYRGGSEALRTAFGAGQFVGEPMLRYYGMTSEHDPESGQNTAPYPCMRRWLR